MKRSCGFVALVLIVASGCRAPMPSMNTWPPFGSTRIPPPSTGSVTGTDPYYPSGTSAPTLPRTSLQDTSPVTAPALVSLSGGTSLTPTTVSAATPSGETGASGKGWRQPRINPAPRSAGSRTADASAPGPDEVGSGIRQVSFEESGTESAPSASASGRSLR